MNGLMMKECDINSRSRCIDLDGLLEEDLINMLINKTKLVIDGLMILEEMEMIGRNG